MILTVNSRSQGPRPACPGEPCRIGKRLSDLRHEVLHESPFKPPARSQLPKLHRAVAENTQQYVNLPNQVSALKSWLVSSRDVKEDQIKLDVSAGLYSSVEDFRLTENIQPGEVEPWLDELFGRTSCIILADSGGVSSPVN